MEGQDTQWKVLEGAWVVETHGLEFRCCTECNINLVGHGVANLVGNLRG